MGKILYDWNDNEIGELPDKGENPMLIHGRGPAGKRCQDCASFRPYHYHDRWYYKCVKRGVSHGAGTDHKMDWPACKKFDEKKVGES